MIIYGQPYGRLPYGRFSDNILFPFKKKNCHFLRKINSDIFFMSQKNFQVKIWWVEKFQEQIGEIKKIYEKNFDREKFIK